MANRAGEHARRWPLRGFGRANLWISSTVLAVLVVVGVSLVIAVGWGPAPAPALLTAAIVLGIGGLIGSQLLRCAIVVTLAPDGTLVLRRPLGTLHTHARRVQRASRSVLNRSGRLTPIVLRTADGTVLLTHGRGDVREMIAAIRRHNPDVDVRF
ncbi:MAG TPA: hypothetical protein VD813_15685 [Pseudonocardia sp.]|nr:hypothetical protein [Pseudonocardia sp.]